MSTCALKGIFEGCTGGTGSKEHIIPNGIGGRKTNDNLICNHCNNESGRRWDALLCNQFKFLNVLFGITKERGDDRFINITNKENGEQIVLSTDGKIQPRKPTFQEIDIDSQKPVISIGSSNKKTARDIIKSYCKKRNLVADYSTLEHREIIVEDEDALNISNSIDLAGPEVGRAVSKMIYLHALDVGVKQSDLKNVFEYLSSQVEALPFAPYYDTDVVTNRPETTPIHVVSVCGSKGRITGYVELYGIFKYIFDISDKYDGDSFTKTYSIDPVNGSEIDLTLDFSLLELELSHYLNMSIASNKKMMDWINTKMSSYSEPWNKKRNEHLNKVHLMERSEKIEKEEKYKDIILAEVQKEVAEKLFSGDLSPTGVEAEVKRLIGEKRRQRGLTNECNN